MAHMDEKTEDSSRYDPLEEYLTSAEAGTLEGLTHIGLSLASHIDVPFPVVQRVLKLSCQLLKVAAATRVNQAHFKILDIQIKIVHETILSSVYKEVNAELVQRALEWLYGTLHNARQFLNSRARAHRLVLLFNAYQDRKKLEKLREELRFAIQLYRIAMSLPNAILIAGLSTKVATRRGEDNVDHERSMRTMQRMSDSTAKSLPRTPVRRQPHAHPPLSPLNKSMNVSDTDVVYNHRRR
ncbi:hypothetical protein EXIGLDRAFT_732448 [Exidia glandulosa HHB12029]|uniref:Uncharacterized protein n=1 Tax=Exidia glandulosa HHB12029 TaxID=1314781 RepID=A0A165BIL1_EXIGL|nr:hypothetical protein EXIGLDRAFT_732448 [Exidia glandulosa HHB12029]